MVITGLLAAYLLGSIPTGFILVKSIKNLDIRQTGSGSTGATNVARVLGKKYFFIVTFLDVLKGIAAVYLMKIITTSTIGNWPTVLAGIFAILGHIFPVWLKFKGGKGVNTALGIALLLYPFGVIVALIAFLAVFLPTRIVSISSLSGGVAFALSLIPRTFLFDREPEAALYAFGIFLPLLFIYTHRQNIKRLIKGNENSFKKEAG